MITEARIRGVLDDFNTSFGSLSSKRKRSKAKQTGDSKKRKVDSKYEPENYEEFLKRVETYSLTTWFGKPLTCSSLECARNGWVNVGVDMLQCLSCNSFLCFRSALFTLNASEVEKEFISDLERAHEQYCPWRGSPSPFVSAELQKFDREELLAVYNKYKASLLDLPRLPFLSSSILNSFENRDFCCEEFFEGKTVRESIISILAISGWYGKMVDKDHPILACNTCQREVGIWNFKCADADKLSQPVFDVQKLKVIENGHSGKEVSDEEMSESDGGEEDEMNGQQEEKSSGSEREEQEEECTGSKDAAHQEGDADSEKTTTKSAEQNEKEPEEQHADDTNEGEEKEEETNGEEKEGETNEGEETAEKVNEGEEEEEETNEGEEKTEETNEGEEKAEDSNEGAEETEDMNKGEGGDKGEEKEETNGGEEDAEETNEGEGQGEEKVIQRESDDEQQEVQEESVEGDANGVHQTTGNKDQEQPKDEGDTTGNGDANSKENIKDTPTSKEEMREEESEISSTETKPKVGTENKQLRVGVMNGENGKKSNSKESSSSATEKKTRACSGSERETSSSVHFHADSLRKSDGGYEPAEMEVITSGQETDVGNDKPPALQNGKSNGNLEEMEVDEEDENNEMELEEEPKQQTSRGSNHDIQVKKQRQPRKKAASVTKKMEVDDEEDDKENNRKEAIKEMIAESIQGTDFESDNHKSTLVHPLKEHRWHCPWVQLLSDSPTPGWVAALQAVLDKPLYYSQLPTEGPDALQFVGSILDGQ